MFIALPRFVSIGLAQIDFFQPGLIFWMAGMNHLFE